MKRVMRTLAFLTFMAVVVTALFPQVREETHWHWISFKNTESHYNYYLKTWPAGRHVVDAERLYDDRGWEEAKVLNTVHSFDGYLKNHLDGRYVALATNNLEALCWEEARTVNTVLSYQEYLHKFPGGMHVTQARDQHAYSSVDEIIAAMKKTTIVVKGWKEYTQGERRSRTSDLSPGQGYVVICEEDATVNEDKTFVELGYTVSTDQHSLAAICIAMTRLFNEVAARHPNWRPSSINAEDWLLLQRDKEGDTVENPTIATLRMFGNAETFMNLKTGVKFSLSFTSEGKLFSFSISP